MSRSAKIFIGLVIVLVVLCTAIAMQPADFQVQRSATIHAPVDVVFEQVNDVKKSQAWSPWLKMEPDAKVTLEGPAAGEGAAMTWDGNKIGAGTMTIIDSRQDRLVQSRLDFVKPFKSTSTAEFLFIEQGDTTTVTWTMSGKNNFMGKAMGLFMNCDKMIGEQFEQGLANLKSIAEAQKS
jgi:hypothetical protein